MAVISHGRKSVVAICTHRKVAKRWQPLATGANPWNNAPQARKVAKRWQLLATGANPWSRSEGTGESRSDDSLGGLRQMLLLKYKTVIKLNSVSQQQRRILFLERALVMMPFLIGNIFLDGIDL